MNVKEVKEHFGCTFYYQLAEKLDLSRDTVYDWNRNGVIPYDMQVKLQNMTNGELVMDKDIKEPCRGGRKPWKNVDFVE